MLDSSTPENTGANLIPLTDNDGVQAVMGRDLHAFLESKEPYTRWMNRLIEKYGFLAGQDFMTKMSESTGGRPSENHILTMDMAKEISMVQNNEKGREARQYFIECERRAKQATPAIPRTYVEALRAAADNAERAEQAEQQALEARQQLEVVQPKAEAYDQFMEADGTYSIGVVAKMLGYSQNKLFDLLRNKGVLIAKGALRNTPYQRYMHHFAVNSYDFERSDGTRGTSYTTKVQPSGIDFIRRKLVESAPQPSLTVIA